MSKRSLVHGATIVVAVSTFQCSADEQSAPSSKDKFNPIDQSLAAACGTTNVALNRPTAASSVESGAFPASAATDGNTGTRWSSAFGDPQWIRVDLGSVQTICGVRLNWETAYGKAYQIQVSNDGNAWSNIYSTTNSPGGTEDLTVNGSGRYVRVLGSQRATQWGYSLWELQIFAAGGATDGGIPDSGTNPPGTFWDASGIPPAQNVMMFKFLNRTNGVRKDTELYWSFKSGSINETHSFAERPLYDMPANSAGRLYFYVCLTGDTACASDPTKSRYFDFIEHTIGPHQYNGNTTRVDAFGLKIAMLLRSHDGSELTVGEDYATFAEDRAVTFQKFVDSVPAEFKGLAQAPNAPYRIVEPGAGGFNAGGPYQHYYDSYVNQIWSANGITIPKPGPNGDGLGAYPDLSAAIYRHVGAAPGTFNSAGKLLNQQLWANASTFYTAAPANYYAKFWHDHSIGGKAYGFPYDDVGGYSTFISHDNPQYLLVAVGW
ncbi:beta-1,3-glucanase family protein [Pendulispora brunnea]|uniref:Beta-1,3-glucanase family protein n=1 Tax=Pendulispora brunnea TaxID=2905690 RepID=A0ABZ2K2K3_9BACT